MTAKIFSEYLIDLDFKMKERNWKIALVLDRCTAHPKIDGLKNTELFF